MVQKAILSSAHLSPSYFDDAWRRVNVIVDHPIAVAAAFAITIANAQAANAAAEAKQAEADAAAEAAGEGRRKRKASVKVAATAVVEEPDQPAPLPPPRRTTHLRPSFRVATLNPIEGAPPQLVLAAEMLRAEVADVADQVRQCTEQLMAGRGGADDAAVTTDDTDDADDVLGGTEAAVEAALLNMSDRSAITEAQFEKMAQAPDSEAMSPSTKAMRRIARLYITLMALRRTLAELQDQALCLGGRGDDGAAERSAKESLELALGLANGDGDEPLVASILAIAQSMQQASDRFSCGAFAVAGTEAVIDELVALAATQALSNGDLLSSLETGLCSNSDPGSDTALEHFLRRLYDTAEGGELDTFNTANDDDNVHCCSSISGLERVGPGATLQELEEAGQLNVLPAGKAAQRAIDNGKMRHAVAAACHHAELKAVVNSSLCLLKNQQFSRPAVLVRPYRKCCSDGDTGIGCLHHLQQIADLFAIKVIVSEPNRPHTVITPVGWERSGWDSRSELSDAVKATLPAGIL